MANKTETSDVDHRLGAQFFNETWTYLEKPDLSPEEAEAMIHCCHASFHHWKRAADCSPKNLGIGYWQLARVYEKAGIAEACARFARKCLEIAESQPDDPDLTVGAHEVLARAAAMRGDRKDRDRHLNLAREALAFVTDAEDRKIYEADIAGVPRTSQP